MSVPPVSTSVLDVMQIRTNEHLRQWSDRARSRNRQFDIEEWKFRSSSGEPESEGLYSECRASAGYVAL